MNRKISLIAPIMLALTICMLARPASASPIPETVATRIAWNATGTSFVCKNGAVHYGSASIWVNATLVVNVGLHQDVYNNTILLLGPAGPTQWGFLWTIVQTKLMPNGNIMFYAVPLTINTYGNSLLLKVAQAGPDAITAEVSSPITAPRSLHYMQSWINVTPEHALSMNFAYFYGWTLLPPPT